MTWPAAVVWVAGFFLAGWVAEVIANALCRLSGCPPEKKWEDK